MSKHIQAYFRNEDEAEGARASLIAVTTAEVEVGRLSDSVAASDWSAPAFYPMSNNGFTVASGPGTMSAQGLFHVVDMGDGEVRGDLDGSNSFDADRGETVRDDVLDEAVTDETDEYQYVLSTKVSDEQYESVVHKLRSLGAFIETSGR